MMFCRLRFLTLILSFCVGFPSNRAEIIYDNTQFILSGYGKESREYGDQLDLEGTGRTLTELSFYYYAELVPDGDERMKVRIYSNELPYDLFRQLPSKLLYESDSLPFAPGYSSRTISNLNVKLPLDTVTVTVEFTGLKTNEVAGLLFYGPPTVGASFNEFWGRTRRGSWEPFFYSRTDATLRANAGIRLVAEPEPTNGVEQATINAAIAMRSPTNAIRLAQTFSSEIAGRLDLVSFAMTWKGAPVRLSLLDTVDGKPGSNVLASVTIEKPTAGRIEHSFYDQSIYLAPGKQYTVELKTDSPLTESPQYALLCSSTNSVPSGQLWSRLEVGGDWRAAALPRNATNVDAVFSVAIVPAAPPIRITSPPVGEVFHVGQNVRFAAELKLPPISKLWRVRFFDGNQEIQQVMKEPFEVSWKPTTVGTHTLKAVAEDEFLRPFRSEVRTVSVVPAPPARDISIDRATNGAVALRFIAATNENVRIEYTADFETWTAVTNRVSGTGTESIFVDDGAPKTEPHPKNVPHRFYRLIFEP